MKTIRLAWGQDQFGRLIHVKDARRGKACECVCPDCATPLLARQGQQVQWHFAHALPVECTGESVLHKVAKQVLVDAVEQRHELLLPSDEGKLYGKDLLGGGAIQKWVLRKPSIKPISARPEVRLREDLITDVLLLGSATEPPLAVEIYVTHAKTDEDIDKFIELKHDSIEIDLSDLQWDADVTMIREAVLQNAPRKWLYSVRSQQLVAETRSMLDTQVESTNGLYRDALDEFVRPIQLQSDIAGLDLEWPRLEASVTESNAFGVEVTAYAEATPVVTQLKEDWERVPGGWRVRGVAGKKSVVDVLWLLTGTSLRGLVKDRPALVIALDVRQSPCTKAVSWYGHAAWMRSLERRAEPRLQRKLDDAIRRKKGLDSFIECFKALPDQKKLQYLAKRLNVSCPSAPGKLAKAWNTTWSVWKAMVWLYRLRKYQGDAVHTHSLAGDKWLSRMLGWSDDDTAVEMRAKNLWFWFRELEEAGFLSHMGSQWFEVKKSLPDDFVPWRRLTKTE